MVASYTAVAGTRANAADVNASLRNGPACSVTKGGVQTAATGTYLVMTFDTENFDSDGLHSTASNTSRITIPAGFGGVWRISGTAYFTANATGIRSALFVKNGAGAVLGEDARPAATGISTICKPSALLSLVAGDYVELWAYQTSGGNLDMLATTTFEAHYVRTTP